MTFGLVGTSPVAPIGWDHVSDSPAFDAATVLRTSQVFCRVSPCWDVSDVFPMIRLGWGFAEKTPEVQCHCHTSHQGSVPLT